MEELNEEEDDKERLCPQAKTLEKYCSCYHLNDCGNVVGEACFFPAASCLKPCYLFEPATEYCACSLMSYAGEDAAIVQKGGVCGSNGDGQCSHGCFYCFKGKCQICFERYARSGGQCVKCPENCWKCRVANDELKCVYCMLGAEMGKDHVCRCVKGYDASEKACQTSPGDNITECYKSQYFDEKYQECRPCVVPGCAVCNTDPKTCDICFTGARDTTVCEECSGNCSCLSMNFSVAQNCAECDSLNSFDGGCKTCATGYAMDETQNCITRVANPNDKVAFRNIIIGGTVGVAFVLATTIVTTFLVLKRRKLKTSSATKFKGWLDQKYVLYAASG